MYSQTKIFNIRIQESQPEVEIIPVIDLLNGNVVHAQRGQRSDYLPIKSSLCAGNNPLDIVQALLELYPFTQLYIADLNAIQHQGDNAAIIRQIRSLYPQMNIWLDAGFTHTEEMAAWHTAGISCVLGSESMENLDHYLDLRTNSLGQIILSLDFNADGYIGPDGLLASPEVWPDKVIVMSLPHVGSELGPDLHKLEMALDAVGRVKKSVTKVYAAGGIRNSIDMASLKEIGVAGVLVATALHNGSITSADVDQALNIPLEQL